MAVLQAIANAPLTSKRAVLQALNAVAMAVAATRTVTAPKEDVVRMENYVRDFRGNASLLSTLPALIPPFVVPLEIRVMETVTRICNVRLRGLRLLVRQTSRSRKPLPLHRQSPL